MERKYYNLLLPVILTLLLIACNEKRPPATSHDTYQAKLEKARLEKWEGLKDPVRTPFNLEDAASLDTLSYYPFDPSWRITTSFKRTGDTSILRIPTSSGRIKEYISYAYIHFTKDQQQHQLLVFKNHNNPRVEPDDLIIMFRDKTSAKETYGGGRYIEIKIPSGDSLTVDFNTAFYPYCAYADGFSCPIPPRENTLNIAVKAGENTDLSAYYD